MSSLRGRGRDHEGMLSRVRGQGHVVILASLSVGDMVGHRRELNMVLLGSTSRRRDGIVPTQDCLKAPQADST